MHVTILVDVDAMVHKLSELKFSYTRQLIFQACQISRTDPWNLGIFLHMRDCTS